MYSLEVNCPQCKARLRPKDFSVYVDLDISDGELLQDNVGKLEGASVTLTAQLEDKISERGYLIISCWCCSWNVEEPVDVTADIAGPVSIKHKLVKEVH